MNTKQNVNIKGTKEGLIFLLNDECPFDELIIELKNKLENSHQGILSGPITRVIIKTGYRNITDEQQDYIREIFKTHGNLFVYSIDNEVEVLREQIRSQAKLFTGIIRSGQTLSHDGNILLVGDVNPGGNIVATGDIFILGTLKGIAHAGKDGDDSAIVAASVMESPQIRIADYISELEAELKLEGTNHNFAYVKNKKINLGKIQNFSKLRKTFGLLT